MVQSKTENNILPNICMWGQAASGKTVLLGSALAMLQARIHAPTLGHHYRVDAIEKPGKAFNEDVLDRLRIGELPGSSPLDKFTPFSLKVSLPDHNNSGRYGRAHILRLADIAGEHMKHQIDFSNLEIFEEGKSIADQYWMQMRQSRGILFVVDIDRPDRQMYRDLINRFVENMEGKFEDKFLAICITKADTRFRERTEALAVAEDQEKLVDLLNEATGGMHYGTLAARFPNRNRIFLTSSAGWFVNESGVWQPNIKNVPLSTPTNNRERPTLINTEKWKTFHVVHALLWLFDKLEMAYIHESNTNPLFKQLALQNRIPNLAFLKEQYKQEVEYP